MPLTDLPTDALGQVLYRLPIAHDIALVKSTCRQLHDAAKHAMALRPFSGKVVTLDTMPGEPDERTSTRIAVTDVGDILVSCEFDMEGTITRWHGAEWESQTLGKVNNWPTSIAVLPDGRFITGSDDEGAMLWTSQSAFVRSFDTNGVEVKSLAVLPDGVHFAVGLARETDDQPADHYIRLFHIDGALIHIFKGHIDDVTMLVTTRDGQHIISGADDYDVRVWSVASKSLVSTCEGHAGNVWALSVTPDDQRILSGAEDRSVCVWRLNGDFLKKFDHLHPRGAVCSLLALPDNRHALSGAWDMTVKLFCIDDGSILRSIAIPQTNAERPDLHGMGTWVIQLELLRDRRRFAASATDGTVLIYEHGLVPQ